MHSAVLTLLILSAVVHAGAVTLLMTGRHRSGRAVFAGGWLLLLTVFILNWLTVGEPPFGNMFNVMVVVAGLFLPAWLLVAWKDRLTWTAPAFAALPVLLSIGAACMDQERTWTRMPALQSGWFVPHVGSYLLAYSLAGAGFLLLAAGWAQRLWFHRADLADERRDRCRRLHGAAVAVVRFGFPCMSFGLVSGALWAEEAWGRYWSWDAKETWSLVTWLCYAIALHCALRARLRPWAPWAQLAGFAALVITLFGVTYLPWLGSVLHGYG